MPASSRVTPTGVSGGGLKTRGVQWKKNYCVSVFTSYPNQASQEIVLKGPRYCASHGGDQRVALLRSKAVIASVKRCPGVLGRKPSGFGADFMTSGRNDSFSRAHGLMPGIAGRSY
eukprot:975334-Prorocentrum_minimum.AAC.1